MINVILDKLLFFYFFILPEKLYFRIFIPQYDCNKNRENLDRERRIVLESVIHSIIGEHRVKISLFNFRPYFI
jgi:hypothetical protein